ncbi:hypothetical protein [Malonomonas rubra]|uniref:hypothetical protein n=1 Tax=Malonomonas rubra TaxID=57040 RepID=UPI0026EFA025|nr:hypothetical protein [Malonomonas rubra]
MKNKLLRLAEIIQQDLTEDLAEVFRSTGNQSLAMKIEFVSAARSSHQKRAEALWLQASKKRTLAEKRASAQADLAAFVVAYLTGDGKEHVETAVEALQTLGRQGEIDLVTSLVKR